VSGDKSGSAHPNQRSKPCLLLPLVLEELGVEALLILHGELSVQVIVEAGEEQCAGQLPVPLQGSRLVAFHPQACKQKRDTHCHAFWNRIQLHMRIRSSRSFRIRYMAWLEKYFEIGENNF